MVDEYERSQVFCEVFDASFQSTLNKGQISFIDSAPFESNKTSEKIKTMIHKRYFYIFYICY